MIEEKLDVVQKNLIALSIDVEDWFNVRNMRDFVHESEWDSQELRVNIGIKYILHELEIRNIKATFFILGWIAERCPGLVKEISQKGHEICSHGYAHTPIDLLDKNSFELDLNKSIDVLESISGKVIKGFRAPSFSITKETFWAFKILKKCGIEYDSSVFSIAHPDYGIKDFTTKITQIDSIIEVPLSKGNLYGFKIPVCGGGYFRILPYLLIKATLRHTLKSLPVVMYFHPWEFDYSQPRVKLPLLKRFRHYVGLRKNRSKFEKLLDDFEFTTIEKLIGDETNSKSYSGALSQQFEKVVVF